jgi:hypothetical protein
VQPKQAQRQVTTLFEYQLLAKQLLSQQLHSSAAVQLCSCTAKQLYIGAAAAA